jgi:hypothetical protein
MNFEEFFVQLGQKNIEIKIGGNLVDRAHQLDNEALFQLPFISMVVLLMAKDRNKPIISQVGRLVGESIEASIPGFKGSAQHLGWSANLRMRTVKAISFLELANLIEIDNRKNRIRSTELGSKVVNKALSGDDDLAYNLSVIARSYRHICVSNQLDMVLE